MKGPANASSPAHRSVEIEALREAGVVKGANPPVPVRNLQSSFSHPAAP